MTARDDELAHIKELIAFFEHRGGLELDAEFLPEICGAMRKEFLKELRKQYKEIKKWQRRRKQSVENNDEFS